MKEKNEINDFPTSSGIILGIKDGKVLIQPTNSKLPNRNHFVVGGPGSFKTQSYIISNVLHEKECSIVVTDPKGEVYELTAEVKRKQGYEVHVINFDDMRYSDKYNCFDYVKKDRDATTVANTLVAAKNNPKNKDIWYNAQLSLLKALILYSIYEMPQENRNMSGVLNFLQEFDPEVDETGISELDEQFMRLEKKHPARRAYELGFKKAIEKTRSSIIISKSEIEQKQQPDEKKIYETTEVNKIDKTKGMVHIYQFNDEPKKCFLGQKSDNTIKRLGSVATIVAIKKEFKEFKEFEKEHSTTLSKDKIDIQEKTTLLVQELSL